MKTFYMEISVGASWLLIEDEDRYEVSADQTLASSPKTWRKITAQSPVVAGNVLVHAVPEMVTETVKVMVSGQDQTDLQDNVDALVAAFEQFAYTLRITRDDNRELWYCQLSDVTVEQSHVMAHNTKAFVTATIPRSPTVGRERI